MFQRRDVPVRIVKIQGVGNAGLVNKEPVISMVFRQWEKIGKVNRRSGRNRKNECLAILLPDRQAIGELLPRFFIYRKELPERMDVKFVGKAKPVDAICQR